MENVSQETGARQEISFGTYVVNDDDRNPYLRETTGET